MNSGNNWYKDMGADFYLTIKPEKAKPTKVGHNADATNRICDLFDQLPHIGSYSANLKYV